MRRITILLLVLLLRVPYAAAMDVGSDGSDGALQATTPINIDLSAAATGAWNSPGSGAGVYDPSKWAVVFKYSSIDIADGASINFTNHPSGAPVVWLVQGDVHIAPTAVVFLTTGCNSSSPGGFRGGLAGDASGPGSGGFGPGGGAFNPDGPGGSGGYGTAGSEPLGGGTYGNQRILPLIGGSGGGVYDTYVGGSGGGAILIAANGTISLSGSIIANGVACGTSGSGGAIRLVANSITGSVTGLTALPGDGSSAGVGRIRLEAVTSSIYGTSRPAYSYMTLGPGDLAIWPASGDPTIRVTTFGGEPVPADPRAPLGPQADVYLATNDSVEVRLEAAHVPVAAARRWSVSVRMVRRTGLALTVPATFVDGDSLVSTWSAKVPPLPDQDIVDIQARAHAPQDKARAPEGN